MLQTIGRILGRVMIILLAAGVVAGGVYALSQSAFGAGPAGFPGGPRDGQAQFAGASPGQGQTAPDGSAPLAGAGAARPGRDFGGPGGREGQSLARGLPELLKNVVIIGITIGAVSLVRYATRRRPAPTAA